MVAEPEPLAAVASLGQTAEDLAWVPTIPRSRDGSAEQPITRASMNERRVSRMHT